MLVANMGKLEKELAILHFVPIEAVKEIWKLESQMALHAKVIANLVLVVK